MTRRTKLMLGSAGAIAVVVVATLAALIGRTVVSGGDGGPHHALAATTTAAVSATSTVTPGFPSATASSLPVGQATNTPHPVVTPVALEPTAAPTVAPAAAVPSTNGPAVTVKAVSPRVGTEITTDSVPISVEVDYEAGPVSNVLGWTIYYCYGPTDCNTYSRPTAYDIQPGTAGSATLTGLFTSGSTGLRRATICRLSVVMGHFVTPEVQWDSQTADRPVCHPQYASVTVLDVQPALNSALSVDTPVSVNLRYDARPITSLPSSPPQAPPKIRVSYYADSCVSEAAVSYSDLTPGTMGVTTIKIAVAPATIGRTLWHISARIVSGDTTLAAYGFGPC